MSLILYYMYIVQLFIIYVAIQCYTFCLAENLLGVVIEVFHCIIEFLKCIKPERLHVVIILLNAVQFLLICIVYSNRVGIHFEKVIMHAFDFLCIHLDYDR